MPFPIAAAIMAAPAILSGIQGLFGGGKKRKAARQPRYQAFRQPARRRQQPGLGYSMMQMIGGGAQGFSMSLGKAQQFRELNAPQVPMYRPPAAARPAAARPTYQQWAGGQSWAQQAQAASPQFSEAITESAEVYSSQEAAAVYAAHPDW